MLGEDLGDGLARGFLDLAVGVDEGQVEPIGEPPADGGLARAHQADEHDRAPAQGLADLRQLPLAVILVMFSQA